jgi:PKD repeat protein
MNENPSSPPSPTPPENNEKSNTPPVPNIPPNTTIPDTTPPSKESTQETKPIAPSEEKTEEKKEKTNELSTGKIPTDSPPTDSTEQRTGSGILLKWFLILAGILIALFYFVLLWGLLSGNVSNPLFETLGIKPVELQKTLLMLTNGIFAFLALIFLIGTLIKFFQWLMVGKDAANRREYGIKASVFITLFAVVCGIWVGLFWLITNANAENRGLDSSMIQTKPANVIGLTAPVKVEFDIGTQLFQNIDPSFIRQINWDFDGDTKIDASGPKVTKRFIDRGINNGRYPVTATVSYFSPSLQEEKSFSMMKEVIISNEAVSAIITADPEAGSVPLKVTLDAQLSKDPDGSIVLYEWDMDGDGEYEVQGDNVIKTTKTFSQVGEFIVRLRVTGSNNDVSVAEKKIVVGDSEENLRSEIIADEGFEGVAPFRVVLNGGQSFTQFGEIVKYEWMIEGEEKSVLGRTIQRTFRKPGEYSVTLTIENDLGEKDRITEIITVSGKQKSVQLNIRTTPAAGQGNITRGITPFEITFDSSQSNIKNPIEWRWDFQNDGIVDALGRTVKTIFRKAGTYDVKLTIVDAANQKYSIFQKVIVGRSGTQSKISASPLAGIVPLMVEFDGSASTTDKGEIVDYIWQFPGEDPIHYGARIFYEFKAVGTFPVKLGILTSEGETDETTSLVSVRSQPLQAHFEAIQDRENPLKISFDPRSSTGTFMEYFWDFGNGKISREFMPNHTYDFPGEYEVMFKITDNRGIISIEKQKIRVTEN